MEYSHDNSTDMVSCISIVNVTEESYGNYTVKCNNGIDPHAIETLQLLPSGNDAKNI